MPPKTAAREPRSSSATAAAAAASSEAELVPLGTSRNTKLGDFGVRNPAEPLEAFDSTDPIDYIEEIAAHAFFLAELGNPENEANLPFEAPAGSDFYSPVWRRYLQLIAINLRAARLFLTSAELKDVDGGVKHIKLGVWDSATSFKFSKEVKAAILKEATGRVAPKGKDRASRPTGEPAAQGTSAERTKLEKLAKALRLIRAAERQRELYKDQAERASANASEAAWVGGVPHNVRAYRARCNIYVETADDQLVKVIQRSVELEALPPGVPGRDSPPPVLDPALGDLPVHKSPIRKDNDPVLRDFSQELDLPTVGSSRAPAGSPSPSDSPDRSPAGPPRSARSTRSGSKRGRK